MHHSKPLYSEKLFYTSPLAFIIWFTTVMQQQQRLQQHYQHLQQGWKHSYRSRVRMGRSSAGEGH